MACSSVVLGRESLGLLAAQATTVGIIAGGWVALRTRVANKANGMSVTPGALVMMVAMFEGA